MKVLAIYWKIINNQVSGFLALKDLKGSIEFKKVNKKRNYRDFIC